MDAGVQRTNVDRMIAAIDSAIAQNPAEVAEDSVKVRVAAVAATALTAIGVAFFALTAVAAFSATYGLSTILLIPAVLLGAGAHSGWVASRICGIVHKEAESRQSAAGALVGGIAGAAGLASYQQQIRDELHKSPILRLLVDQLDISSQ